MRLFLAVAIAAAAPLAAHAQTAPATSTAAAKYTTADTTIETLMGDPAAKAVLMKHIPEMAGNEQFAQAGAMTLKQIQQYASDALTDAKLAAIDADLAKVPAK